MLDAKTPEHKDLHNECVRAYSAREKFHTLNTSVVIKYAIAKNGQCVPQVYGDNNRWNTLHSRIDPQREAQQFAQKASVDQLRIPVVLGAGMGYHIEELIKCEHDGIFIIIEKNAALHDECLKRFRQHAKYSSGKLVFLTAETPEDIIDELSRIQVKHNFVSFQFIRHIPSVRAYQSFYQKIQSKFDSASSINLPDHLLYSKFTGKNARILILHSKYYLLPEILNSLKILGHASRVVMVQGKRDGNGSNQIIENIISAIIDFKPDFILTINHLGFDREGILTNFFSDLKLPFASWYVDSPTFILEDHKNQISQYLALFLWDYDYINDLKNAGFDHVHYLPLATDPVIFKKMEGQSNAARQHEYEIGFVGSSGNNINNECRLRLQEFSGIESLVDKAAEIFLNSDERYPRLNHVELTAGEHKLFSHVSKNNRYDFEAAVTWRASQRYRIERVLKICSFEACIHGDPGWKALLDKHCIIKPELNYYEGLNAFYNACRINFNTTSLQMKTGVNQRVFDVPAAGGFLLTDYRKQLEELFDPGTEVITYRDPEEIAGLSAFYLKHPTEREKIVRKAYRRIRNEHTYVHRLQKLINIMRETYE